MSSSAVVSQGECGLLLFLLLRLPPGRLPGGEGRVRGLRQACTRMARRMSSARAARRPTAGRRRIACPAQAQAPRATCGLGSLFIRHKCKGLLSKKFMKKGSDVCLSLCCCLPPTASCLAHVGGLLLLPVISLAPMSLVCSRQHVYLSEKLASLVPRCG